MSPFQEVSKVFELSENRGQRLVAIGGGTGLSTLLAGLKQLVGKRNEKLWIESLSAIVTVSDDGGSSGRLRDELQMLPPGDIRNCMIALSEDEHGGQEHQGRRNILQQPGGGVVAIPLPSRRLGSAPVR